MTQTNRYLEINQESFFGKYFKCAMFGTLITFFHQATGYTQILTYGAEVIYDTDIQTDWVDEREEQAVILDVFVFTANAFGGILSICFLQEYLPRNRLLISLPIVIFSLLVTALGFDRAYYADDDSKVLGQALVITGLIIFVFTNSFNITSPIQELNTQIYPIHRSNRDKSIAYASGFLLNFGVGLIFLSVLDDMYYGRVIIFLVFAGLGLIFFLFKWLVFPHLENKSINDNVLTIIGEKKEGDDGPTGPIPGVDPEQVAMMGADAVAKDDMDDLVRAKLEVREAYHAKMIAF